MPNEAKENLITTSVEYPDVIFHILESHLNMCIQHNLFYKIIDSAQSLNRVYADFFVLQPALVDIDTAGNEIYKSPLKIVNSHRWNTIVIPKEQVNGLL